MTGIKQGDTLFSRPVAPTSDPRSAPPSRRGCRAHTWRGQLKSQTRHSGRPSRSSHPLWASGRTYKGLRLRGWLGPPCLRSRPLGLVCSVPAERCEGAPDAPGRRPAAGGAGRGLFPWRGGRASGGNRRAAVAAAGTGTGGAAWGARGARLGPACSSRACRPLLVLLVPGSGPAAGLGLGLELALRLSGPGLGPEPRALRPGVAGLALCEDRPRCALGGKSAAGEAPRAPGRGEPGRQPAVSWSPLIRAGGAGTAGAAPPGLLLAAPDLGGCSGAGAGCH